jgi:hypothetical protein
MNTNKPNKTEQDRTPIEINPEDIRIMLVKSETIAGRCWDVVDVYHDDILDLEELGQKTERIAFPHTVDFWEIVPCDEFEAVFHLRILLGVITPKNAARYEQLQSRDPLEKNQKIPADNGAQ